MGTRHLCCIIKDNEFKVAQYGQWDGYPTGAGIGILEFLRKVYNPDKMKEALTHLTAIDEKKLSNLWKECGPVDANGMVDMDTSRKFAEKYPHLSRDCGFKIYELVQAGKAKEIKLSQSFAEDSLFCEWAYIINMDNNTLEVYEGFNKRKLAKTARFYKATTEKKEYYPVRLVKAYSISELPTDEVFITEVEPKEDE